MIRRDDRMDGKGMNRRNGNCGKNYQGLEREDIKDYDRKGVEG